MNRGFRTSSTFTQKRKLLRVGIELLSRFTYTSFMKFEKVIINKRIKGNRKTMPGMAVFFLLAISVWLGGQTDNIRFRHISIEDGLSQSTINCIHQDKKGFMWFGTRDGLNRYDGYKFVIYNDPQYPKNISEFDIWSICEDTTGDIWIGTYSGEVNRFERKTGKFFRYDVSNKQAGHKEIRAIVEDSRGIIWVGTYGGGLYKYAAENDSFTHYPHSGNLSEKDNQITSICEYQTGNLWVGTEAGLYQFDRKKNSFIQHTAQPKKKGCISHNRITSLCKDGKGFLWIGTKGGGLNKFDPTNNCFTPYTTHDPNNTNNRLSSDNVSVVFEDSNEVLWIGTYDGGLNRFDRKTGKFIHYKHNPGNPLSISKNYITSIYEDRTGTLWIGTRAAGLNILPKNFIPFSLYRFTGCPDSDLDYNDIRAFYEEPDGILWIGTLEGGLKRFDRKTGNYTNYNFDPNNPKNSNSLSHNFVRAIHEDRSGRLWIGTEGGGLNKLDRKTGKFTRYQPEADKINWIINNEVQAIYEDRDGNLWLGTNGGLEIFNPETEKFKLPQYSSSKDKTFSNSIILAIYEDHPGMLWIGTQGDGLYKFDIEINSFTRYKHKVGDTASLSNDEVWSICKDHNGVIWVGTSCGLNKLLDQNKKNGLFKSYLEKDGLPNKVIYSIVEDNQGNLWIGTNKGLVKFNPKNSTFKNYDSNDGLQSDEFNYGAFYKNGKGELLFGGINGFNAFFPGEIKDDAFIPPIVITDLLIANKSVEPGWKNPNSPLKNTIDATEALILTHQRSSVFSFEFAALHYANPKKNEYKYMLEGWDKDWIKTDSKNRRATYTNLSAGDYIFKVKGSNKDGAWNENGTSIKVKILPSLWMSWWAYTLYVIAGVLIIFLIWAAWSKKFLKRKVQEQTQKLKDAQSYLIQSEKMASLGTLLSGVAHELNNPAAFIKMNSEFFAKAWKDIVPVLDSHAQKNNDFEIGGLRYKDSKEDIEKLIPGLLDGSNRVKDIIDELKIFSRKEDTLKTELIDLNKVIRSSIYLTQNMIKKSTQDFSPELAENLPYITGNFQRLERVIINLIQNACQALTVNTQRIFISTTYDKDSSRIVIKVKDEGVGIEEKDLKYITDPFFTTKRDSGGVGLGLSISLQIIQEHGGTMDFKSTPGQGTTVFIYLPVRSDEEKRKS